MKKDYRIKRNEEFARIIGKKDYHTCPSFVLYKDNKKEENSRIGISVSKKIGNAVIRNKVKRQVRMMCLDIFDFNNSKYDYVIIVKNAYLNKSFLNNKNDLENLFKKDII